jgi:hypothetical protein
MAGRPLTRIPSASAKRGTARQIWRRAVSRAQKLDRSTRFLVGFGVIGSAVLAWVVVMVAQ